MSDNTSPDPPHTPNGTDPATLDPLDELVTASRATAAAVPTPTSGYVLAPDQGVDERGAEVKCSNRSTGGSLAMYRTVVDGQGPPRHQHVHEDETIVVLEGTMEVDCGDDTWQGGAGTVFFLPRGVAHTFRSVAGAATILFVVTPGHLDDVFRLREHAVDPAQVRDLMQRFM